MRSAHWNLDHLFPTICFDATWARLSTLIISRQPSTGCTGGDGLEGGTDGRANGLGRLSPCRNSVQRYACTAVSWSILCGPCQASESSLIHQFVFASFSMSSETAGESRIRPEPYSVTSVVWVPRAKTLVCGTFISYFLSLQFIMWLPLFGISKQPWS